MIDYPNGTRMLQPGDALPDLRGARSLYLDVETTSGDPKLDALNPWHHCAVAGVGLTVDESPVAWYAPVGHADPAANLPRAAIVAWLRDAMTTCGRWVNHNVKYDAHVLHNDLGIDCPSPLVCTLTLAKIVDSDRHGYGLDVLSKAWLHDDIARFEEALQPYLGKKNKDYGRVPADVMAPYCGQDVMTDRRLFKYEDERCHAECRRVWDTEIELTSVLLDVERRGMRVDPLELKKTELLNCLRMSAIETRLEKLVGRSFRPHVNDDCFDVLCNQYGLPVLAYTDTRDSETGQYNPSFDKQAMAQYAVHPYAPKDVVELMLEYRHLHTLNAFFVAKYQDLHVNGILHSSYNQCIRTGRMSCKDPNAQQLSPDAKKLVHPRAGNAILSSDYSQIEFRIIVHYIRDKACISAYATDPNTDFHQWVADMIPMPRRPAKNVNFMMGYGGGRKKCVAMLAANKDVVGDLKHQVDALIESGELRPEASMQAFELLCQRKANSVYDRYHETLPTLRSTSVEASRVCELRGYVRNMRGRHRNLPRDAAHKAFNTICQSSAADIMKERTVALWKAYRGTPLFIIGSVHDDTLTEGPAEVLEDPRTVLGITSILEATDVDLRVAIRCSGGSSRESWYAAGKASVPVPGVRDPERGLDHLR